LYQLRSTWQWAALEVEAQQAACFLQYCCMSNVREYKPSITRKHTWKHTSKHTWNILVQRRTLFHFRCHIIILHLILAYFSSSTRGIGHDYGPIT
jgi:hypothetical protein